MKKISSRRVIITIGFLVAAVLGGITRYLAPNPSLARDLGTLLLVLWLPIIGNVIAWLVARPKVHRASKAPPGFDPASPFELSARAEITLFAADVPAASRPIPAGLFLCAIVIGSDGFSARLMVPGPDVPQPEKPMQLDLQFLKPELALPKLPVGTEFVLLAGREALGRGVMVERRITPVPETHSAAPPSPT